jgi:hypothetical protein
MNAGAKKSTVLTRRRFVTLVAAGSAALLASPALAATAKHGAPAGRATPASLGPADRKEFLRQRASTNDTLKTIRGHAMGPGTEMAGVFHPLRGKKKS